MEAVEGVALRRRRMRELMRFLRIPPGSPAADLSEREVCELAEAVRALGAVLESGTDAEFAAALEGLW